ncbi:MAG: methyltransferase domain-containing protein [Candidatus Latescibacteria bacterium]|nr:methyltransferase domain-containing protein [Candidatus Latescibacterota bacterium]NIO55408.1 methyltransferase domain-containing protein [Candidatus Latescibacterota bacterium]
MKKRRTSELMRSFWDSKARENALYYVSSYRPYDEQDPEEFWKWGRILAERFLGESQIDFTGEETVLEIGCGIGRMTAYFSERFRRVDGIDVSPEMISQAEENLAEYGNVGLHVGNGCDLSNFDDSSFDFVFSYITFQHIPDPRITAGYIREAGRVLKTGGHFYFQVNNMPRSIRSVLRIRSRGATLLNKLRRREEREATAVTGPRDLDSPAWQGSRTTVPQIDQACIAGGLKILSLEGEGSQYLWIKAIKQP